MDFLVIYDEHIVIIDIEINYHFLASSVNVMRKALIFSGHPLSPAFDVNLFARAEDVCRRGKALGTRGTAHAPNVVVADR